MSRDKQRLAARTRFMIQDLLECRKNGWKERHAKDGPHKLGATKIATATQQQAKNDTQHRRDQERSIARERQRQVLSQQHQPPQQHQVHRVSANMGGDSSSVSTSQDVRQLRNTQPATVRILARDQELAKAVPMQATSDSSQNDPEKHPPWTEERLTNRVRSALDEYAVLGDADELIVSLDEVPLLNNGYKRAFEFAVGRVVEGKDAERDAALGAVRSLLDKERLKPDNVMAALLETLEFLPDIAIDSPKAVSHVASRDGYQLCMCVV